MSVLAVTRPLPLGRLSARALVGGDGWYPRMPSGDGWRDAAAAARATVGPNWLEALAPALDAHGAAKERLEKAAANGAVVTTGQQPGLFGGPLYTWHKAMTVLAFADELERRLGIPVAPVFWAATDDSDVAEGTRTVVSIPGGAETIELAVDAPRDTSLAHVSVGDARDALARLRHACGSAVDARAIEAVEEAYSGEATLGGAYVQLLRALLEPWGIAVLDAAHPATRTAAAPFVRTALHRASVVEERLYERTQEIVEQGLRPQVRPIAGRTLVFAVENGMRKRVRTADAQRAVERLADDNLSPNVLLRPIAEKAILPTIAYVAGPAELAYFAQVSAIAHALDVAPPLAVPRWSGFVIEPHVQRILEKLGVGPLEFADAHALETRIAHEELPAGAGLALADIRERASSLGAELIELTRSEELPVKAAVLEGASRQLLHKIDRLERRLVAAVKRRGSERLYEVATARGALFPNGVPQERALNVIPLLARYGTDVLDRVLDAARTHVSAL